MASLVEMRTKQEAVQDVVKTAANNNTSGITVNLHHRLASDYNATSRYDRRQVMGDPFYYAEVLPSAAETDNVAPDGQARAVLHRFDVWLIYEWSDAEPYAGSSQETFNNIVTGHSPNGVLPALRAESYRSTNQGTVVFESPEGTDIGIAPLGADGGEEDTAHYLSTTVPVTIPNAQ